MTGPNPITLRLLLVLVLIAIAFSQASVIKKDNMCRACLITTQLATDLIQQDPSLKENLDLLKEKVLERSPENRIANRAVFMSVKVALAKMFEDDTTVTLGELRRVCGSEGYCEDKASESEL